MQNTFKKIIIKSSISIGSLTAIIAPVVTTVVYQVKHTKTWSSIPSSILKSELSTQSTLYQQGYPTHFDKSYEGFKSIYQTLEKIYPEISVDYAKLQAVYIASPAKANDFITFVNQTLMKRGFWSNLWNGIKHVATTVANGVADVGQTLVNTVVDVTETVGNAVATAGTAIATGVVETANVVSGGALDDAAKTMEDATKKLANDTADSAVALGDDLSDLVKDVFGIDFKDFAHSDWLKFGISTLFLFAPGFGEMLGVAQIGKDVAESIADEIINATAKKVVSSLIEKGVELILGVPYVEFTEAALKEEQTLTMNEIKNDKDFPDNFKTNIQPGDYYFKSGDTGIHIKVTN